MQEHPLSGKYREIAIQDIKIPEGRRPTDPSKVASLAASIKETGLLQPIGVTEDNCLVHGAHRLAACTELGFTAIPAITLSLDEHRVKLAEIDENLQRNSLTELEQGLVLAERKQIFEHLHPETASGRPQATGANRVQGRVVSDNVSPTFTEDTATKTGLSRRSVQRKVAVAERLDPEAVELVRGTPVAQNQSELQALAKLSPARQRRIALRVKNGQATSVRPRRASARVEKIKDGLRGLSAVTIAVNDLRLGPKYQSVLRQIQCDFENLLEPPSVKDGTTPVQAAAPRRRPKAAVPNALSTRNVAAKDCSPSPRPESRVTENASAPANKTIPAGLPQVTVEGETHEDVVKIVEDVNGQSQD